jgi:methylthioribulose 1-phosphate dehydratase/enolase-phosphatase E1
LLLLQHLFFGHSQAGDLRPYLCGYFDTSSGLKGEAGSYHNIQLTLGVDDPSEVRC